MEDLNRPPPRFVAPLVLALTTVCLCGAAYAYFYPNCDTCKGVHDLLHGFNLDLAGLIFYATLLVLGILKKRTLVLWGFGFAVGIHLCLVTILIMYKTVCPPCIITAAAAFLALALLIPFNLKRLIPLAALTLSVFVVAGTSLYYLNKLDDEKHAAAEIRIKRMIEEEIAAHPVAPGRVKMILFLRKDCPFCAEFEANALPKLVSEFKSGFDVDQRNLTDPYASSPKVFVCSGANVVEVQDPVLEPVRKAIQAALDSAAKK